MAALRLYRNGFFLAIIFGTATTFGAPVTVGTSGSVGKLTIHQLDKFIEESEQQAPRLVKGSEKKIIWASAGKILD